jgi:heptosyltransferase-2/heptosyltransferase-3
VDLTGRTDLGTLAAVYARCRLVIGPDSGPLHLASAVGTPTVHLFGPADANRFGPWAPAERHRIVTSGLPCAPCGRLHWPDISDHPCVRVIETDAVVAAARSCGTKAEDL